MQSRDESGPQVWGATASSVLLILLFLSVLGLLGVHSAGYFMSESRCWSCGSTSSQQAYFSLMLLVGFGIVCGLALAVAVLKAKMLAQTVTFFMILQQAVQVSTKRRSRRAQMLCDARCKGRGGGGNGSTADSQ